MNRGSKFLLRILFEVEPKNFHLFIFYFTDDLSKRFFVL